MRGELAAVAGRCLRQPARRAFHNGSRAAAAHSFTMPAMSPTMTEGNIASWKVKEGDSFSTGDVLLEIETDKATIDVEAQDDGVVAKILAADGAKGLPVGSRIAVLADPGDDIASLEIPAEEPAAQSAAKEAPPPESPPADSSASSKAPDRHTPEVTKPPRKATKQTYPLYPSVAQLLHVNGLDLSDANKIPASGPSGRLLKGDVLAYLGSINSATPSKIAAHLEKLSHLDLSNIKIRESTHSVPEEAKAKKEPAPKVEENARIALSISFDAIREVQERVQDALGIDVPLQTFISRAIEISNTELPVTKSHNPTADELFNDILGIQSAPTELDGNFFPQMISLAPSAPLSASSVKQKKPDIIDMLTGNTRRPEPEAKLVGSPINESSPSSVFALTVPKAEEKRARIFLERLRAILQVEPGRLVI